MPLTAANLTHRFQQRQPSAPSVLDGVTCSLKPGTITAIVGPNGAGKTTLIRILAGLLTPTEGTVELAGTPIATITAPARAKQLAYLPQRPSLAFAFSVRTVVSFGSSSEPAGGPRVAAALERVGLADRACEPFGVLSAGQQQRAAWARALLQLGSQPQSADTDRERYLLADEPTSALDPAHVLDVVQIIRELAKSGVGVAIVLHDLSLAARLATHAVLLSGSGRVLAEGTADAVLTPAGLGEAFATPFCRQQLAGVGPVVLPMAGSADPHAADPASSQQARAGSSRYHGNKR